MKHIDTASILISKFKDYIGDMDKTITNKETVDRKSIRKDYSDGLY
jgi:hypothetical protein